jgi:hypothetical protein
MKPFEPKGLAPGMLALAEAGRAYLVWAPRGGPISLDLSDRAETFSACWLDARTGRTLTTIPVRSGRAAELRPPAGGPAVLWLTRT